MDRNAFQLVVGGNDPEAIRVAFTVRLQSFCDGVGDTSQCVYDLAVILRRLRELDDNATADLLCTDLISSFGRILDKCKSKEPDICHSVVQLVLQFHPASISSVAHLWMEQIVKITKFCATAPMSTPDSISLILKFVDNSDDVCAKLILYKGLVPIFNICKKPERNDDLFLCCAKLLAKAAVTGGIHSQLNMVRAGAASWMTCMFVSDSKPVLYYAAVASAALLSNGDITNRTVRENLQDYLTTYLEDNRPLETNSAIDLEMTDQKWFDKVAPILKCSSFEARHMAAFHALVEVGAREEVSAKALFSNKFVENLRFVASYPYGIPSSLAANALEILGHQKPRRLSPEVLTWVDEDINYWMQLVSIPEDVVMMFQDTRFDGAMLLKLDDNTLKEELGIKNWFLRNVFIRNLDGLKCVGDFSSIDQHGIVSMLRSIELPIYTYGILQNNIKDTDLSYITDSHLMNDCDVRNGIYRSRILRAIKVLASHTLGTLKTVQGKVFISYRRVGGAHLASLLKVLLEQQGFEPFLDVSSLESGRFDRAAMRAVRESEHFILVLSKGCLDRVKTDKKNSDFVHLEIRAAIKAKCNIVNINLPDFNFFNSEELPDDVKSILKYNSVAWFHETQDGSFQKLLKFLRPGQDQDETDAMQLPPKRICNSTD